ncbi:hypothetical protein ACFL4D_00170 [Candidatus Margulisiibacteriota bacterium]
MLNHKIIIQNDKQKALEAGTFLKRYLYLCCIDFLKNICKIFLGIDNNKLNTPAMKAFEIGKRIVIDNRMNPSDIILEAYEHGDLYSDDLLCAVVCGITSVVINKSERESPTIEFWSDFIKTVQKFPVDRSIVIASGIGYTIGKKYPEIDMQNSEKTVVGTYVGYLVNNQKFDKAKKIELIESFFLSLYQGYREALECENVDMFNSFKTTIDNALKWRKIFTDKNDVPELLDGLKAKMEKKTAPRYISQLQFVK